MSRTTTGGGALFLALVFGLAATTAGADEDEAEDGRLALGREVFLERAEPRCPICHTLADAGATGAVGPDLDSLRPSYDRVRAAVVNGIGPMKPNAVLDEKELDALAHYVSFVAGG